MVIKKYFSTNKDVLLVKHYILCGRIIVRANLIRGKYNPAALTIIVSCHTKNIYLILADIIFRHKRYLHTLISVLLLSLGQIYFACRDVYLRLQL